MANREFIYWCRDAISGIRYWKDRNKVFGELYEHLEDRYDYFIEKGYTHEQAQKKTLEAMGDPMELAPQLAAIHKPHWAYAAIAGTPSWMEAAVSGSFTWSQKPKPGTPVIPSVWKKWLFGANITPNPRQKENTLTPFSWD